MQRRNKLEFQTQEKYCVTTHGDRDVPAASITFDREDHQVLATAETREVKLLGAIAPWVHYSELTRTIDSFAKELVHAQEIAPNLASEQIAADGGNQRLGEPAPQCDYCGTTHDDPGAAIECCTEQFDTVVSPPAEGSQ